MKTLTCALAALVLGGCAMGAAPLSSVDAGQQATTTTAELPRLRAELGQARGDFEETFTDATAAGGDGGSACEALCLHRGQICAIAARICAIADRHRDHPGAAASCESARGSCADVTERMPAACACEGPPER